MATIDEILEALTSPGETVFVVSKARRTLFERRRSVGNAKLPNTPLIYAVVTSERVMFVKRRMFNKNVGAAHVISHPLSSVTAGTQPRPVLMKEAVQLEFDDDTTATFELPSATLAEGWLQAFSIARRSQFRWDALRLAA